MRRQRGVTLVEVLISATILSMVMVAVMSFYVEAIAITAKRDEQSARLRRFHLGLEKIEQLLSVGRVLDVRFRSVLFLKLDEEVELMGFPFYEVTPAQIISAHEGVLLVQDGQKLSLLETEEGEHVIFEWLQENPPDPEEETTLSVALYHTGFGKRSDLFFQRTINVQRY